MRKLVLGALLISLLTAGRADAQDWHAGVDLRIELISIVFRLAGNNEYGQCRTPAYDKAIESHFAPYRDHEAVRLARALGIGFEAPMKLAVHVRDADSLAERVPFDGPGVHLYDGWDPAQAREFLAAMRRFSTETHFREFVQSQQPLYDAINTRLRTVIDDEADLGWFARFFGSRTPARLMIVPGVANGAPSYAARLIASDGTQEIYAIPGVSKVDRDGLPIFDSDWRTIMAHQIAHVYVSPAIGKFSARMETAGRKLYEPVAARMQQQSFRDWRTVMNESVTRAVTIEYVLEHDGPEAARRVIRQENSRSFFWMSGLADVLATYVNDRPQYSSFEAFMPRVAEYFDRIAPRMSELRDRLQPRVLSTSIAEDASDVSPGDTAIVIRFSMPMSRVNPDNKASTGRVHFDESGSVVTLPVSLEPERDYVIPLRWPQGQPFVSADGVPLPPVMLRFRTGAVRRSR